MKTISFYKLDGDFNSIKIVTMAWKDNKIVIVDGDKKIGENILSENNRISGTDKYYEGKELFDNLPQIYCGSMFWAKED